MRVDEAELRRWQRHGDRCRRDPQVARERELQPATDRVAVQRRQRRVPIGLDRVQRRRERMGDELFGLIREHRGRQIADVVTG